MTLLEIQAVRALPGKYVTAGIQITRLGNLVIALHPDLPPLAFSDGRWIVIVRNRLLDRVAKSNKKRATVSSSALIQPDRIPKT